MNALRVKFYLLSLLTSVLSACGGGGGGGGGGDPSSPSFSPSVKSSAKQDIAYSIDLSSANVPVTSVSILNGPSWLAFNSTTKQLEGTPTGAAAFSNMTFDVTFSDGSTKSYGPYSITVMDDSLKQYQWNLKNSGQNGFSSSSGTLGMDINVDAAHSSGTVGSSSIWLVVSDGRIDLNHEELTVNSDLSLSRNYTLASPYTGNPTSSNDNDYHGTAVASIMAAVGWNNKGIRGVCPSCKLIGYNFLDSDQTVSKQISQASSSSVYVYNYSYGVGTCEFSPVDSSYISQVRFNALAGRYYNGSLFVTSAGNDYAGNGGGSCNFTYLGNSNLDQSKSYPYFIVVSAIDAQGFAATYSTPGSNLWVSAPGGEGGQTKPGLFAADIEGCSEGHSKTEATENLFESNSNGLNANCKYTSTATGTSFASPTVAGVVGLLLFANSWLTWRDVKYILATTAKPLQPSAGPTSHPLGYNLSGHTYQQGWVTNSAGYKFHNWYGFGLVDAGAAVLMAKNYSSNLGEFVITEDPKSYAPLYSKTGLAISIPDNSATGASDQIYLRHNLKIESLQITLSIDHTASSDLGVELTSPSGTKSILMNINSGITATNLSSISLLSNAFYGESSMGNWTLKVIDGAAADTGTIKAWSIKVWGGKARKISGLLSFELNL
ncbi:MAG: S8 family serine peptidase [Bdellovibrionales bacterium]|nr:S8 family serine peptidase [Bdellovibrionales bacterium]